MKKRILLIIIVTIFLLTACKSSEVKSVEQQISSIGKVTEESDIQIQDVRQAYEDLSDEDKEDVSNYSVLEEAELSFNTILSARVDKLIEDVGPINDESKVEIDLVRSEYNKLTKDQKSIVINFGNLIAIEKKYEEYIVNRAIDTLNALSDISPEDTEAIKLAKNIYGKLTDEQKNQVSKEIGDVEKLIQNAKISRVERSIQRIKYKKNEPNIDDLTAMIDALTAYLELSENLQSQVKNYEKVEKSLDGFSSYIKKRRKTDEVYIRYKYIKDSNTVSYDDLLIYPKSYEGHQLGIKIEIIKIDEGILMLPDEIAAIAIGTDNLFELKDNRSIKEPILSEEDILTIYGTFEGTKTITVTEEDSGLFGTNFFGNVNEKYEIPIIEFVYTSNDNLGLIGMGDPSATDIGIDQKAENLINQLNQLIDSMQ